MILIEYEWPGMALHMFLHLKLVHLLGNLAFLWIFGNAINLRVGGIIYILLFITYGIIAGLIHARFDGSPAIGASGAIFGLIGFFVALQPTSYAKCFWWALNQFGTIYVPAFLLVVLWVIGDIFGLFNPASNVGHAAHLGGFAVGLTTGFLLVSTKLLIMRVTDRPTLPEILSQFIR